MGLDMYAIARRRKPRKPVDFNMTGGHIMHYWRKHPNLHGWMEQLYRDKGGQADQFNCEPVLLTSEDLDQLEAAVKGSTLPETEGFFFGATDGTEIDDDLAFIAKARKAIADGLVVFYYAWW